jgi:hypothetical protein
MKPTAFSKTDLEQLQRQLSDWRVKQSGPVRLPEAVWRAATQLARTRGTGLVAPTLRLDYYKLRNRVRDKTGPEATPPAFVEIKGPQLPGVVPEEGKVEVVRRHWGWNDFTHARGPHEAAGIGAELLESTPMIDFPRSRHAYRSDHTKNAI